MIKHAHDPRPKLTGHCLIHNKWDRSHIIQFLPSDDGKTVTVTSWNVPLGGKPPWVLVARRILKLLASRDLWKEMRARGYRVMEDKRPCAS